MTLWCGKQVSVASVESEYCAYVTPVISPTLHQGLSTQKLSQSAPAFPKETVSPVVMHKCEDYCQRRLKKFDCLGTKCSLLTQASLSYAVEHRALGLSTQFVLKVGLLVPWVLRISSTEISPTEWHRFFETEKTKHSKGVKNGLAIWKIT